MLWGQSLAKQIGHILTICVFIVLMFTLQFLREVNVDVIVRFFANSVLNALTGLYTHLSNDLL